MANLLIELYGGWGKHNKKNWETEDTESDMASSFEEESIFEIERDFILI